LDQERASHAVEAARRAGILGLFRQDRSALAAILSREETALGREAENVIGALTSADVGQAWGLSGLGAVGTGRGGGGTGEGTLGLATLGTLGRFGGGGASEDGAGTDGAPGKGRGGTRRAYGDCTGGACGLAPREPRGPIATPGILAVKGGGLDKEIIRRVVRRHVNEVRYCYEQGMRANPTLGGRVVVSFTIGRNGEVLSSVLQSSSLRSTAVESCVVQAVRRWSFPRPSGGGLAIVSYPFLLTPAGALTGNDQSSD
jgi:TonB family protein